MIQGILGYERLETTGIYIHLRPKHLKREYEKFWVKRRVEWISCAFKA